MDVGTALRDGWRIFVRDIGPLIVAGFIAVVLSGLTIGILGGPLYSGLIAMLLARVRDGREPKIGDVFSRFDRFGTKVAAFYLLAIGIAVGIVLFIVPGLYLAAIWLYVFPLIVDRGLGVGDALRESRRLANANGIGSHMVIVLVLGLISLVIGGLFGLAARDTNYVISSVAEAFLLPYTFAVVIGMYARVLGHGYLVDAVAQGQR